MVAVDALIINKNCETLQSLHSRQAFFESRAPHSGRDPRDARGGMRLMFRTGMFNLRDMGTAD
jgi:hypothetical protein